MRAVPRRLESRPPDSGFLTRTSMVLEVSLEEDPMTLLTLASEIVRAIRHIPGCLGLHGARMLRQRCACLALKNQAKAKQDDGDDAHG